MQSSQCHLSLKLVTLELAVLSSTKTNVLSKLKNYCLKTISKSLSKVASRNPSSLPKRELFPHFGSKTLTMSLRHT